MKESTMNKTTNKQSIASMTGASELHSILGNNPDFEEYDMNDEERTLLQSLLQEATQCRLDKTGAKYTDQWAHLVSRRQYYYYYDIKYKESVNAIRSFLDTMRSKS